jgi:hypothetical protein
VFAGNSPCNGTNRLYCFGINNNFQVTVKPVVGRIAFVTKDPWIPSGGLLKADELCQSEASDAGLSGAFKALLADVGHSAASRFDASPGSLPWVRPDGVAIAPTAADLFSADFLDTAINQTADGQYVGNYGVWGGAQYPNEAGTQETTCNNWASSSNTNNGRYGVAGYTYQLYSFGLFSSTCDATNILRCLQY